MIGRKIAKGSTAESELLWQKHLKKMYIFKRHMVQLPKAIFFGITNSSTVS